METFSLVAIRLRAERRARRRPGTAVAVEQPRTGEYAHQGHRMDLPDERLISHREPRWIDGRRYRWNGRLGAWMRDPDPQFRQSKPKPDRAPRQVVAVRGSEDDVLRRAVRAVVDEGGRPEEVTVVVKD